MWKVYVILSRVDGKRYVGMSNDVVRRIKEHNAGLTKSTKGRRPFDLIYSEDFSSREEARDRERYFKTGAGRRYLNKIQKQCLTRP